MLCESYGIEAGSGPSGPTTNTIYESYKNIVQTYEDKYGKADTMGIGDSLYTMTGVCFISLIDFDNNGAEELVLVHKNTDSDHKYTINVWEYQNNQAELIHSGDICQGGDVGSLGIEFTEYNGQTYLISGFMGGVINIQYYGFADGEFKTVRNIYREEK